MLANKISSENNHFHFHSGLHERMFRVKPYTRCMDCINNARLKCRRCMDKMIDQVSKSYKCPKSAINGKQAKKQHKLNFFEEGLKRGKASISQKENIKKSSEEKLFLISKYEAWIEETKKKKHIGLKVTSKWPRKIKVNDRNLQKYGIKQPKFETWEKKLLNQLMSKTIKV